MILRLQSDEYKLRHIVHAREHGIAESSADNHESVVFFVYSRRVFGKKSLTRREDTFVSYPDLPAVRVAAEYEICVCQSVDVKILGSVTQYDIKNPLF